MLGVLNITWLNCFLPTIMLYFTSGDRQLASIYLKSNNNRHQFKNLPNFLKQNNE